MGIEPPLTIFRTPKTQVPTSRQRFAEGQPFEFGLGNRIVQELGFSTEGSKNPTT
jgi:hypothetical protein